MITLPGAIKSNNRSPFASGRLFAAEGRFEKLAGASSVPVRADVDAPTAIADETHAGEPIFVNKSSFPLATILATPTERNASIGALIGSDAHALMVLYSPPPKLIFTAAKVPHDAVLRLVKSHSNPLTMSDVYAVTQGFVAPSPHSVASNSEKTCTEMIFAAGATPENVRPPMVVDFPAMIPATWVP